MVKVIKRKVNKVKVNIKTRHVTYNVSRDFNPKDHDMTIVFPLGYELCLAYRRARVKLPLIDKKPQ